jgi:hypothetical protein
MRELNVNETQLVNGGYTFTNYLGNEMTIADETIAAVYASGNSADIQAFQAYMIYWETGSYPQH